MSYEDAREAVYGMNSQEWKDKYQQKATLEKKQRFEETKPLHAFVSGYDKG